MTDFDSELYQASLNVAVDEHAIDRTIRAVDGDSSISDVVREAIVRNIVTSYLAAVALPTTRGAAYAKKKG